MYLVNSKYHYISIVKNILKIGSVIIVLAYYSYTLGMLRALPVFAVNSDYNKTDQVFYLSTLSDSYFCYTTQKENSNCSTENVPELNIKLLFISNREIIKNIKQIFDSEFNQYSRFSGNLLIHYSKTIIIFPFNYFW